MTKIALGTKVFSRGEQLEKLLDSVPKCVDQVYVADDGKQSEKKDSIYEERDINVINLEYDKGLSAGRNEIVERSQEDYICIVDTDHRVPNNIDTIIEQLESSPEFGGIGGILVEPENNQILYIGQDFEERNDQEEIVRSPYLNKKDVEIVSGSPIVRFDFIPNAAVFRREVLEEYPWDEEFVIGGEHGDFYVNHWHNSDWKFGINPAVNFLHYPGGDEEYISERKDDDKLSRSHNYFMNKWEYKKHISGGYHWGKITEYGSGDRPLIKKVKNTVEEDGVKGLITQTPRYLQRKIHSIRQRD